MTAWHDFFIAEVGATAALTGLLFVALSINLGKILEVHWLPNRAAQSLLVLVSALLMGAVLLFPGQSAGGLAAQLGGVFLGSAIINVQLYGGVVPSEHRRHVTFNMILNGGFYALCVAGIVMLPFTWRGVNVIAFSTLYALCYGILNAWVLLVEILR